VLAKDSPVGYLRLANALTEQNDLHNAKENYETAASLAPNDKRLESLARDADKRLQLQIAEAAQSVQRLADAERDAQRRADAKKAEVAKIKEDEQHRREREKTAAASKKATLEHEKAQRREAHEQRQKEEAERRATRRAEREEERAHRAEIKAQEDAQRQRAEMAAEKKRHAAELVHEKARLAAAKEEAEQARITSLKWKKTLKERQLVNEEKMRMLAKQRQERRKMEREHALERKIRSRQVAAILASSGVSDVPSEFICPLAGSIRLQAVTAADGCSYEKSAIQAWQSKNDTSPMTDERITKWLMPHHSLQRRIEAWLAANAAVPNPAAPRPRHRPNHGLISKVSPAPVVEPEPEPEPEPESEPEAEALDPISLEPLSELRYPPFNLPIDADDGNHAELYDARVLSNYLVSSGNFSHPTSRRPLQRAECQRMDTFIRRHRLGRPCVTASFDHQAADSNDGAAGSGRPVDSAVERHREEASEL